MIEKVIDQKLLREVPRAEWEKQIRVTKKDEVEIYNTNGLV